MRLGGKELDLLNYFRQKCLEISSYRRIIGCFVPLTFFINFSSSAFPTSLCLVSGSVNFLWFGLMQIVISASGILAPLLPSLQNGLREFIILMGRDSHTLPPHGCHVTHTYIQSKSPAIIGTKRFWAVIVP